MSIKKRLRMSLAASLFFLASISAAQAQYSGGSGTADDPYQIATAPDLIALGETPDDYDKHFKLMADINMADLGETSFAVIGSSEEYPFRGVFDGNHHTVYNLVHNPTDVEACGLFGFIDDPNAEVRDLELADPNIGSTDTRHAGSVAGMLKGGVVRNCGVTGGIVEGRDSVGGLVGRNRAGTIYNSYASVTVLGGGHIGGLIGQSTEGMISACWATGEIAGYTDLGALGGLVGVSGSPIVNCYASTSVTGNGVVGGLVGRNDEATIVNSYAAGLMPISEVPSGRGRSGSSALRGGLVGYNNRGAALNSFWDVETSGISRSDGGIGKTTAQMQDPNTFLGWSCELPWTIDPGNDYPRLWWEGKPGQSLAAQVGLEGDGTTEAPYRISTAEELDRVGAFFPEWDKHFILTADIDFSDHGPTEFRVIGASSIHPFTGTFDGNGHTITNFRYRCDQHGGPEGIGLFGYLDGPVAEIRDVGLVDPNIETGDSEAVGTLVGRMEDGMILGCWTERGLVNGGRHIGGLVGLMSKGAIADSMFDGSVSGGHSVGGLAGHSSQGNITACGAQVTVSGNMHVGGLVGANLASVVGCYTLGQVEADQNVGGLAGDNTSGWISKGTINGCYSSCTVSGHYLVGGLVGDNDGGTVTDCYATGAVTGGGLAHHLGGLAGRNLARAGNGGIISTSYAAGDVSGDQQIGGLVGYNIGVISDSYAAGDVSGYQRKGGLVGENGKTVTNCYSTGRVEGRSLAGGLIGAWDHHALQVTGCFWDTQTCGQTDSAGGAGKTTAEMQTASTFLEAGWDFVDETENGAEDMWKIAEGLDYPRLWWEQHDGQVTLEVGQRLAVTLESNPSTGYLWEWVDRQEPILEAIPKPLPTAIGCEVRGSAFSATEVLDVLQYASEPFPPAALPTSFSLDLVTK